MRILNTSDACSGGAATACRRLVRGLANHAGIHSCWLSARPEYDRDARVLSFPEPLIVRWIRRWGGPWRLRVRLANFMTRRRLNLQWGKQIQRYKPDLINLHNIHGATDIGLLKYLPDVPVAWTLHDMWPLTGYCCYSYECDRFTSGCRDNCPQAGNWGEMPLSSVADEWRARERLYRRLGSNLSFITPSSWMADQARRRLGDAYMIHVIPNGLDLSVFKPCENRRAVRLALGLPPDAKIALTVAQNLVSARKGWSGLRKIYDEISENSTQQMTLVAVGNVGRCDDLPENWVFPGRIRDEKLLNMYYNAADVYVHPSLADNLPNTLVEATAAGTPSVTFDVGGCPEVVRHGETGYVAHYRDMDDLTSWIRKVLGLSAEETRRMRAACREKAIREYDVKLMADRYSDIFNRTLRNSPTH